MWESWLGDEFSRLLVLVIAVGVPFVTSRLLEDEDRRKGSIAFASLLLFEVANWAIVRSIGYSEESALLLLVICAIIGSFSREIVEMLNVLRREEFERILPNRHFEDIRGINYQELWDVGYRLIVFDVDHTLLSPDEVEMEEEFEETLIEVDEIGFKIGILSNTIVPWREGRVREIIASLSLNIHGIISVCCNFFHCKPNKYGFKEVCRLAGVLPENAIMVGDMLGRDIGGAKKAGFGFTILVKPNGKDNIWVWPCRRKEREPIKEWLKQIGHHSLKQ